MNLPAHEVDVICAFNDTGTTDKEERRSITNFKKVSDFKGSHDLVPEFPVSELPEAAFRVLPVLSDS